MAPRYPHAQWRPLGLQTQPRMRAWDIICLHTMVGSLYGTDVYFKSGGYGGTESHFGVGHDGETFQWQDLDYSADANYRGSNHIISIETADLGPGFPKWNTNDGRAVPAWTDAQIDRLADLVAWSCHTFNIPPILIPDSKPGRRGIGYHRQGVPGYVVPGGELWSTARGKVCPGDRRIAQIPLVIDKARRILGSPSPSPSRPQTTEDDMGVQIFEVPPSQHIQPKRIAIPVGSASGIIAQAWITGVCNGPDKATARVWAQSDNDGIADRWLNFDYDLTKNLAQRDWWELPNGTTQLNMHLHFPQGGSITLEWKSK